MHSHAHAPGHAHAHPGAHKAPPLATALAVTTAIALLEFIGGLAAHSLALLSDSGHVLMDAVSLGVALFAARAATRPANDHRSFGYARVEILAALGNAVLLFGITVWIAIEAVHRFGTPQTPSGGIMLAIAGIGALANAGIGSVLARAAHDNINARAALFHVLGDVVGATAVALGGAAVLLTHATWIDPVLSLGVAALIVAGVVRIVREAADVLLESAPGHLTMPQVRDVIRTIPGVLDVHDLHVWTIGPSVHVLSAHVLLPDGSISEASAILRGIDTVMRERFAITHVTVQFECESCSEPGTVVCTQRL